MGGKYGTKETLEVIDTIDASANAIRAAKADGNVNWMDSPKFVAVLPTALKAIKDSEKIKLELEELDTGEAQDVFDRMMKAATNLLSAIASGPTKK